MEYRILDSYRKKKGDTFDGLVGLSGLIALVVGAITDSSAVSIAGGAGLGYCVLADGVSYAKAFMEATLDFKANGKFTRLKD